LHGDDPYTVDRRHRTIDGPHLGPSERFRQASVDSMKQEVYTLDEVRRRVVLESIREVCRYKGWLLLAVHVRSTHVHLVVQASGLSPEQVMTTFKAYASRALNHAGVDPEGRKRWTRHGSTRYINTHQGLLDSMRYVKEEQGEPMELWVCEDVTLIP
jgi:REP element-mobilizing transposase RayT